ncbi:hypothetical protein [Helcococcus bovis]|uniref:hypothetical protein n=1 Tax=Helcococcus bovis TaxID=3153252 RepID=UPI0038BA67D8
MKSIFKVKKIFAILLALVFSLSVFGFNKSFAEGDIPYKKEPVDVPTNSDFIVKATVQLDGKVDLNFDFSKWEKLQDNVYLMGVNKDWISGIKLNKNENSKSYSITISTDQFNTLFDEGFKVKLPDLNEGEQWRPKADQNNRQNVHIPQILKDYVQVVDKYKELLSKYNEAQKFLKEKRDKYAPNELPTIEEAVKAIKDKYIDKQSFTYRMLKTDYEILEFELNRLEKLEKQAPKTAVVTLNTQFKSLDRVLKRIPNAVSKMTNLDTKEEFIFKMSDKGEIPSHNLLPGKYKVELVSVPNDSSVINGKPYDIESFEYVIEDNNEPVGLTLTLSEYLTWTKLTPATPIKPSVPWTELTPATPIKPSVPWTELTPATPIKVEENSKQENPNTGDSGVVLSFATMVISGLALFSTKRKFSK